MVRSGSRQSIDPAGELRCSGFEAGSTYDELTDAKWIVEADYFFVFLDNGKEYPALTSKEATATNYKACSSSVYEHNGRSKQKATKPTQKFDEDGY